MSLHPQTVARARAIAELFAERTRAEADRYRSVWWTRLSDCLVDGLGPYVGLSPFDAAKFIAGTLGDHPPPDERLPDLVGRWLAGRMGVLGAEPATVDDARQLAGLRDVALELAELCEAIAAGRGAGVDARVPRLLNGHLATLCQLGGALIMTLERARGGRGRGGRDRGRHPVLRLVRGAARTDGAS